MGDMTRPLRDWAQDPYPPRQGSDVGDNVSAYAQTHHRVVAPTKPQDCVQLPGLSSLLSADPASLTSPYRDFNAVTPSSSTPAANYATPSPERQMPPHILSSGKVYGSLSGSTGVHAPMSSSDPRLSPAAQSFASSDRSSRHHSRNLPAHYHQPVVAAGYSVTCNDRPALASASPYRETKKMSVAGLLSDTAPHPMMSPQRPLGLAQFPTERKTVTPVPPQMPSRSRYKRIQARLLVQQQLLQQPQPQKAHDACRTPSSTIPTTRTSGPVMGSEYRIWVRQQPMAARSCGFGERDRRVIDPPPIVQMAINMPGATREEIRARMRIQFAVLHCSIWDETGKQDNSAMPEDYRQQRRLMGTLVSSPFVGEDEHGEEGCFFCFPDLSCRTPGAFRLKFVLVVLDPRNMRTGGSSPILATTMSGVFIVYSAKDFPGMQASTALTKRLKQQGCLISIKKGNDKTSAAHDCESEDDDDGEGSQDDRLSSGKGCKRARKA
ncbi:nuclear divisionprotein rft1 [Grosmannia clavigera kw1407]|uniref:Nuclear divisionprotein rft1 n=1 Tax=Grosmannia clavigera (strain kw1407 / UAMH 11150) TaxID=655863 RepID=F0XS67_GROCL|nr:nuclear divisionprotein rft1 [Grosmannia clavigera kw1407]EFW99410.1 nuclear divisionprotein rft1 [Grosmannia clavigera kw1407]